MKKQKGFTLIELLVVISIVGLLAAIGLLALNAARIKARDTKRLADIKQVSTALEVYFNEWGGYPEDPTYLVPDYMGSVPAAPMPPDGSCNSTENDYTYANAGTGELSPMDGTTTIYPDFTYTFCLGNGVDTYPSGMHTLTPQGIN